LVKRSCYNEPMRRGGQSGFTLVEITIVLAISALLLLLLSHQHQANSNSAFTGAIDQLQNELTEIKSQALNSKNDVGSGNNSSTIEWGKGVVITGNTFTEYNLTATSDSNGLTGILPTTTDKVIQLPWQITTSPSGSTLTVAFVRNPGTGSLEIYFPASLTSLASYATLPITPATIDLRNTDGHSATITIDPASQTISRSIDL
jgi:prepilin-type N-terminal cleavage/methylation domain-containing protein